MSGCSQYVLNSRITMIRDIRFGPTLLQLLTLGYLLHTSSAAFYGGDYYNSLFRPLSADFKTKVETLGAVLKRHVQRLRATENGQVELVFLVDSSSSVGADNFFEELRFVRKLLADFTVDVNKTRVSVITFSSRGKVIRHVDHLTQPNADKHKCRLLGEELPRVNYIGGGTYTLGAFLEAKVVLKGARKNATKAIFLITDGFSNGGDPRPEAKSLRDNGVKIFTFGIRNGNFRELYDMASVPKNETCYILDSFEEFEALARRALHEDLHTGSYVYQPRSRCNILCKNGGNCCHANATCACGTHTGKYECQCKPGFYGQGIGKYGCKACPPGTYKNISGPGDVSMCMPCPDENQTTGSGTAAITDCSCKKGYVNMNTSECAAFTCPALDPPENGYFVNNKCNNVFNAACGLRCKPGYELQGSSLRICQENGTWSGVDASCVTKTCPTLPVPKDGQMICSRDDFTFSTVCRFTCDNGYQLVGSRKRTCVAIAVWTGLPTRCREITCQPLTPLKDGSVHPAVCTAGEVSFGTTCQMTCLRGYTMYGPHTMQCTPDGNWAPTVDKYNECLDEKPPFVECPSSIETETGVDDSTAEVIWQVPVSVDNSGFLPTMTAEPAVSPSSRFPIGINVVTYIVEDFSKNKANCSFTIKVKDTIPPTVDKCFSPPSVVSPDKYGNVTWEEPQFSDNSEEGLNISRSHDQGWFPIGVTQVTYTATDGSGNNNTCILDISVIPHPCEFPPPPVNGNRTCHETDEAVHCSISCHPGYAFAIPPAEDYRCAYDNVWEPQGKVPFPDCSAKQISNDVVQPASVKFTGKVPCREKKILHKIEENFKKNVSLRVSDLCEENFICSVDEVETTCQEGEDYNKIHIGLGKRRRRKRSISKYQKQLARSRGHGRSLLIFDFKLEGTVTATGNETEDDRRQLAITKNLKTILQTLQQDAKAGHFNFRFGGREMNFKNMTFNPNQPKFMCPEGMVQIRSTCVKCPVGMYFNVIRKTCESCSVGTYQPVEGSVACLVCPGNQSTIETNTRTSKECKAQCLPGSFSFNGLERCETCDVGFYRSEYAQTECLPCPTNRTTRKRGSRTVDNCQERCPAGYVSKSGLRPCLPCPKGTFQQEEGQSACFQCPHRALTTHSAASSVTDCEGDWDLQSDASLPQNEQTQILVNLCFEEPCENGGTCKVKGGFGFKCICMPGFTGTVCQTQVDQCKGLPCLHNGTCVNLQVDYVCTCPDGFSGKKCEVNRDECASNPCQHGGTCIDGANRFLCHCDSAYQGATCEENINDCSDTRCHNGGTCIDDVSGYTCTCRGGFTGETCEIEIDECLENPCRHGICHDEENGFSCECEAGYKGRLCGRNINECASTPCQNGGTCEDGINAYTCNCPANYTGVNCDAVLDKNYQLDFPSAGTDHVQVPIKQDMSVVTVSFWMKTNDNINQGTPFSYAIPGSDNALTLTDYDGFAFMVNEEKVMTDEPTNDGIWHHIVITWSANRGSWKLYIDGLLSDSGFNLSTGKPIAGGGMFVIGQEQDSVGGGFDPREAFVGSIAHLNVWDRELPLDSIDSMRTECTEFYGNIVAWPDVRNGIRGALKDATSTFCGDCPTPMKPDYGQVSFTSISPGSTAEYSCIRGFQLAGYDRLQCLVTGEWETESPACQKVQCGYPGNIANGYVEGFNYNYDNRIRYQCQRGFKLEGSKTRYCNEYGEWENDAPTCTEISCELPPISENTRISNPLDTYRPKTVVEFECTPGNRLLTPHNAVRCQSDGTWDKSVPSCDPVYCGSPPNIDNGGPSSSPDQSFVGALINYECDYGNDFAADSKQRISCQPSGDWGVSLPVCEIIVCPDPPVVAHAQHFGDTFEFLSLIEYICDDGYQHSEDDTIECLEGGQWSGEVNCEPVNCGEPNEIRNGEIVGDDFYLNSAVNYECDSGFKLKGNKRRICLTNSSWSGAAPVCKPLVCGKPAKLENGRVLAVAITYGSVATFQCDEGYIINGATEMTCQEDGTWSNTLPVCDPQECPPPVDIDYGYFRLVGRSTYGQTVTYFCNDGFDLLGEAALTCTSNGRWSAEAPTCQTVECPQPEAVEDGSVNILGLTYTSKVEYTCDEGYELLGETVRTCQADKTWTDQAPVCSPLKCRPPQNVANGALHYKDLKLWSIVRYTCDSGYQLVGLEVRRCQADLSWEGAEPTCNPIHCAGLTVIAYGVLNTTETVYQTVVSYSCNEGYTLRGEVLRTCSASKVWTGEEPVCTPVECNEPGAVTSNGRMLGNNFTYGALISYVCDEGYNLVGSQNRSCEANGEWDASIPICEIVECPRPKLAHGRASSFQREFNTVIDFSCKRGFRLEGPSQRTCLSSGQWSGDDPICIKIVCPTPAQLTSGRVTVSPNGLKATYECFEGYVLNGATERSCQESGTWSLTEPVCDRITCDDLSAYAFEHGRVIMAGLEYGSYASFECDVGYVLDGERKIQCSLQGRWSSEVPICRIVSCGPPGAFVNGEITGSVYTYGSTTSYICIRGFELKGTAERTCGADGLWEPSTPRCHSIVCPDLPDIDYGRTIMQSNTLDGLVRYSCQPSFVLRGESSRTCLDTGEWSGSDPSCVMLECPSPPELENGRVVGDSYALGRILQYICNEGYELDGVGMNQCLPTLSWLSLHPTCNKVQCPPPEAPVHGQMSGDSFTYGDTVLFSCHTGYILTGESSASCQPDATWTIEIPTCEPVPCGEPPQVPNAVVNLENGTVFGSAVSLECVIGYNPIGDAQVQCQSDGSWTSPSFRCEIVSCPAPPQTEHLTVEGTYTFGSQLNFRCEVGYELIGIASTCRCRPDGSWDSPFPTCQIISCPEPGTFDHGTISESDNTYQSQLVYTCDQGFEIIGEETRECQGDRTWSGQTPMCILIRCQNPQTTIPNGRLIYPKVSYSYNDEASYVCNDGYEMIGNERIRCLATKAWSSNPPSCTKIVCPRPGNVEHGNVVATDEVLTYTCDDGYDLMGSRSRRCLNTGLWDTDAPACLPVHCPSPVPINHGQIEGGEFIYGQSITYTCDEGFLLVGSRVRRCLATGFWETESPFCDRATCGMPRPPQHGMVSGASYLFEDVVEYSCDFGYLLVGENRHVCEANGKWSAEVPFCEIIVCESPPEVLNSQFTLSSDIGQYSVGVTITYTCNVGYEIDGASTLRCLESRSWSDSPPQCSLVSCPSIDYIENGLVVGTEYTYESTLRFQCSRGYEVVGDDLLVCQEHGSWSSNTPTCEPVSCEAPDSIQYGGFRTHNGGTSEGPFRFNDQVTYFCEAGYNVVGNVLRQCNGEGGWTNQAPICYPVNCHEPPPVQFSTIIGDNFDFGQAVAYECYPGYRRDGNYVLECGASGSWIGDVPLCEKIECGPPVVFDHSSVTVETVGVVQVAKYVCNSGYILQGDPRAVCDMGTWVGDARLDCVPVDCGPPALADYTSISYTSTILHSVADYGCVTGYSLSSGALRHTCQEDGTWSEQVPVCSKVFCGMPSTETDYTGTDYYFGGTISFVCAPGYELVGQAESTCMEEGSWSGSFPFCQKVNCGEPPRGVAFSGSDFTFEGRVVYECPLGYNMEGEAEITCQADGTWSSRSPNCSRVTCGQPPSGTLYSGSDFTYEGSVTYTCPEGYYMVGNAVLTCLISGVWSGLAPRCERVSCGEPPRTADFSGSDFLFGGRIVYTCPEGYNIDGDADLTCEANGEWSGTAPSCHIVHCGRPETEVLYDESEFTYGETLRFYCQTGFTLIGEAEGVCQADGSWSTSGQICIKVNCGIPPTDALFVGSDFSYGGSVRYYCEEGQILIGEEEMTCQEDGTWSGEGQTCSLVDCGPISVPTNVVVVSGDPVSGTHYNDTIQFSCGDGFSLSGESTMICLISGRWSGELPACSIAFTNLCDLAVDVDHSRPVSSGYVQGDSLTVECLPGYEAEGQMESVCQAGGAWSVPAGECRRVADFCQPRVDLPNTAEIRSGYLVGDSATIECEAGYQPQGDMMAECLEGGLWSRPTGHCAKIYCGRPKIRDMVNVMLIGRSYFYGDHVMFMCRPGLTPARIPPRLTCGETGDWDGEIGCSAQCKFECLNGGRCVGLNKCKCMSGWGGIRCQTAICILPCLNGGTCAAPYRCGCPQGYEGTRCHRAICSQPCQNGGRCLYPNRCQCTSGFLPPFCETKRIDRVNKG
ncbi:sushi, von Willebrand factor type A, EGF and pentraxin domain-containing protein 1-like [Haliotis rufescens]|uniref:sushi, von Willebrand factor type A, EGF and pentraxin domain-containing protein 1-like n=1 Tax=Haliotis rufescens TaxID=6454 RepID=UPI00201F7CCB|nr:sushi, von Willebrand factor type A, EGF and pentraxin domain-containing protein 1-like [Haliotis rufescens]